MLKSQAPSRQKVKGRLTLPSQKRQKTTTPLQAGSLTQISAETGTGPLPGTGAPAIVDRWPTPTPVKVSIDRRDADSKPQQQTSLGWQDQHFENKTKNASSSRLAAMNCSSSAAATAVAAGPVKRVKQREQKRAEVAAAAGTEAPGSEDIEWRVPSTSTNLPPRDTRASSRVRSGPQAESPTTKRLPAECDSRSTSSGAHRSSNDSGSSKARSSGSASRTGRTSSPRKKHNSATAAPTKKEEEEEEGGEEEEEGELPPCPYPGHKNVSWTCRGCGGARHHLTSRSAMEPLQRVHGFKV